ncbi:class I SAM-dependent methyltransferase [Micromonospora sp. WMMD1082]|uniref:class I SAM-dependent methyltransferase n=1 Tax=Micromonospora sp. WMMD1082 TaxID=3016104 RepID=UPI002417BF3D|nr:class I SAM-dependent methyltransferase [Micromonospora sp. WMMD1082]MDG4792764.1 class I SAM-dependent methyltransferase [Micromonospora sp. WMMD1082]
MFHHQGHEERLPSVRDIKDLLALQALAPLSSSYLPWTVSSMRPSGVRIILNEIVVHQRRRVVELGSGVSTFYVGRLLAQRGGSLCTVEHDERWADQLERDLAREGLDKVVTVVRAPLGPDHPAWPDEEPGWYERGPLLAGIGTEPIDLLIVDGPPAYQKGRYHARYPAIPVLDPMLAGDYAVILDDIDRRGELDIMDRWEDELGITFDRRFTDGRVGIGRSRPSFSI